MESQSSPNPVVVLCGLGGFGREVLEYLPSGCNHRGTIPTVSAANEIGFLDDEAQSSEQRFAELIQATKAHYLGSIKTHKIRPQIAYLISIAHPSTRARLWKQFAQAGAMMGTYIHPTALVAKSAKIGAGSIICPNAIVNAGAVVEENVVVNVFGSVGHDAVVGSHSVLAPFAAVQGGAHVGEACFLGTRATIFPQVKVGNHCTIDSHSFAKMNVPDHHIVRCRTDYQVIRDRLADSERRL